MLCVLCGGKKWKKKKKVTRGLNSPAPLQPVGQAGQVMPVKIFLRVENINRPHKKITDYAGQPDGPTHFAISNELLDAAQKLLWSRCVDHTKLSVVVRLLTIKSEGNIPQRSFNQIVELMRETFPPDNLVLKDYYRVKKIVSKLGLTAKKIDCCVAWNCWSKKKGRIYGPGLESTIIYGRPYYRGSDSQSNAWV